MSNKLSLFGLTTEYLVLKDLQQETEVNQETGEVTDNSKELHDLWLGLKDDLDVKLNNTMYVIKELNADAQTLKDEATRLTARAKVLTNKADLLKDYIFSSVQQLDKKKIKTDKFNFVVAKSQPSVNVLAVEDLPRAYRKATWSADKKAIKEALQSGTEVEGCSLVVNESLRVK